MLFVRFKLHLKALEPSQGLIILAYDEKGCNDIDTFLTNKGWKTSRYAYTSSLKLATEVRDALRQVAMLNISENQTPILMITTKGE